MSYHVLPVGAVWKVRLPGNNQPTSFHVTREDAIDHARHLARRSAVDQIVVHRADGTIESEHDVGSDQPGRASH